MPASNFPPAASPSISRPPIFPRKAVATICRSHSASCAPPRNCRTPATGSPRASSTANSAWPASSSPSGECCWRPRTPRATRAASSCLRPMCTRRASPRRRRGRRRQLAVRLRAVHGARACRSRLRAKQRPTARCRAPRTRPLDLADVCGQALGKRALVIAAAGGHSVLLIGPPGTGKSMLAQRLPGLLPGLPADEALDVASIASVSSRGFDARDYGRRPFRAPHHSASASAIIGGGPHARPGEVSLAHRGVLFLDELPEFDRRVLESLREPLETGVVGRFARRVAGRIPGALSAGGGDESLSVRISRRSVGQVSLRAAGDRTLPRAHLRAAARPDRFARGSAGGTGRGVARDDSARGRKPHQRAAGAARARGTRSPARARRTNSTPSSPRRDQGVLPLDRQCRMLLAQARARLELSARGVHRVLRVARTIADLDDRDRQLQPAHLAEALQLRRAINP